MKKFIISLFKLVIITIKSMKTWRGVLSLFLSFMLFYGWLLIFIFLGTILKNNSIFIIGSAGLAFWAGPFTPLIPLVITFSLIIQRYVLFDKVNIISLKIHLIDLKNEFFIKKSYIKKIKRCSFKKVLNKQIENQNQEIRKHKDDLFILKGYIESYQNKINFYKKI